MLIEILLFLILGIIAGTITGLIPGIHINLIGAILVSLSSSFLSSIQSVFLIVFISSMAITHTFLDFIPSIFLGCPDTDTELSVLPGHELLKKGQGYEAIMLTAYGSLAAIMILILITIPTISFLAYIQGIIKEIIPYFLILISVILILLEKKKFSAFFVFLLTGILGLVVLNLELNEPLLPLLTGLFGGSMLITSIKNKTKIPKQNITKIKKPKITRPLLGALIASPLCSFLPGMGSGQAAVIGNIISKTNRKGFLILLGATNTLVMGFSFISLYVISRTRTGAAVAIKEIIKIISLDILILILFTIFLTGFIAFFLTKNLAKKFSKKINKINYTSLSCITLLILILLVLAISNFLGLIILMVSILTGLICISFNVKRVNMMGCLLLPVIIFYL